jgi:hypothetical protein
MLLGIAAKLLPGGECRSRSAIWGLALCVYQARGVVLQSIWNIFRIQPRKRRVHVTLAWGLKRSRPVLEVRVGHDSLRRLAELHRYMLSSLQME